MLRRDSQAGSTHAGRWPPPGLAVDDAIAAAEAWYLARGFAPRFKIVEGWCDPPDLAERLAARGYRSNTPTLTMMGPLAGELDPDATIASEPGEAF